MESNVDVEAMRPRHNQTGNQSSERIKTVLVHKEFLTTEDRVIAHNVSIDHLEVLGGILDGAMIGRTDASVQLVRRTENEICFQLQAKLDYLKCICVTLHQNGDDVVARVNFAAYTTVDHEIGYDFTVGQNSSVPVATSPDADGYGVAELSISSRYSALVFPGLIVNITAESNGRYFCANDWGQQDVRPILANRETPAEWEQFVFCENEDCTVSIRSIANGKFLSSEIATDGRVIARAEERDTWEKYWPEVTTDGHVALRSAANHKLLSVEPSIGTVSAKADITDTWEKLTIVPCRIDCNDNSSRDGKHITDITVGVAGAGGIAAMAVGITSAVIGTTTMVTTAGASAAAITAAGAGIGGLLGSITGAVAGSSIGLATGGIAIPATIPFAMIGGVTGTSIGTATATTVAGWLGVPMATTVAVTTAPVWAIPVAVCGGAAALGAGVYGVGRYCKWW